MQLAHATRGAMQRATDAKRITPSAYAKLRRLNKSTISRQVRAGAIPVGADGLLNVEEADKARARNLRRPRGGGDKERQVARRKAAMPSPDGVDVYEYFRSRLPELTRVLLRMGMSASHAAAAPEIADLVLGNWIMALNGDLIQMDQKPLPPCPESLDSEVEAIVERAVRILDAPPESRLNA